MLERGLRAESRDKVISALENVAFEPEFSPVIVQDILGHYSLESPLSLKTIWFCLRQRLMVNIKVVTSGKHSIEEILMSLAVESYLHFIFCTYRCVFCHSRSSFGCCCL